MAFSILLLTEEVLSISLYISPENEHTHYATTVISLLVMYANQPAVMLRVQVDQVGSVFNLNVCLQYFRSRNRAQSEQRPAFSKVVILVSIHFLDRFHALKSTQHFVFVKHRANRRQVDIPDNLPVLSRPSQSALTLTRRSGLEQS